MTHKRWIVYSLIRGNVIDSFDTKKEADRRAKSWRLVPMFGVIHRDEFDKISR